MEMEVRLDAEGRTTYDPSRIDDWKGKEGVTLDFSPKAVMLPIMASWAEEVSGNEKAQNAETRGTIMDDLLLDCEIADLGLLPRTFWISGEAQPRFALEQLALEIFHHHVPAGYMYDPCASGAEWWVQIRPSPSKTGRYSMLLGEDEGSKPGIDFHWDKDEELRLLTAGKLYVHPHISTVTYLTNVGAPTFVLDCLLPLPTHAIQQQDGLPLLRPSHSGFLSWPKTGKHFSFDGRFLHAAPSDLIHPLALQNQLQHLNTLNHISQTKIFKRRQTRLTFLVNIWLNYRPMGVQPFPDTFTHKMTSSHKLTDALFRIVHPLPSTPSPVQHQEPHHSSQQTSSHNHTLFTWPLGCDSNGYHLQVPLHLDTIQSQMSNGGNVHVHWETSHDSPHQPALKLVKRD